MFGLSYFAVSRGALGPKKEATVGNLQAAFKVTWVADYSSGVLLVRFSSRWFDNDLLVAVF